MKYETIDDIRKAFIRLENKLNLPTEIQIKVNPEPIICIWLPKLTFQGEYKQIVRSMVSKLEKSGWIPLVFAMDGSEVKVKAFTIDNAKRLDLEKLKETITNELKGE